MSDLLGSYFPELVDTKFTASMEETLDEIAEGKKNHLEFLRSFYSDSKTGLQKQIEEREQKIDPEKARAISMEKFPDVEFRIGRFGPYLEMKDENKESIRASIPEDIAPADLDREMIADLIRQKKEGPPSLGVDPRDERKSLSHDRALWALFAAWNARRSRSQAQAGNGSKGS